MENFILPKSIFDQLLLVKIVLILLQINRGKNIIGLRDKAGGFNWFQHVTVFRQN